MNAVAQNRHSFIYAAFKDTNVDGGKNGPGYDNEECKSDSHAPNLNPRENIS